MVILFTITSFEHIHFNQIIQLKTLNILSKILYYFRNLFEHVCWYYKSHRDYGIYNLFVAITSIRISIIICFSQIEFLLNFFGLYCCQNKKKKEIINQPCIKKKNNNNITTFIIIIMFRLFSSKYYCKSNFNRNCIIFILL